MLSPFSTFEPIFFVLDIAKFFDLQPLQPFLTFATKFFYVFDNYTIFDVCNKMFDVFDNYSIFDVCNNFFYVFDNYSIFDVSKLSPQTQIKTYYASTKICTHTRLGFQFQFRRQIFVFINMYIFPAGIDVFLQEAGRL